MPELATILIVEDLPDDGLLLRHALKRAGIRNPIQDLPHGRAAVDYLLGAGQFANRAAFPLPGLIISGYRVSPMGGVELVEWMQQQREFRDIPVAILSGIGSEQDMARAYAAGAKLALPKSGNYAQIAQAIKKAFAPHLSA